MLSRRGFLAAGIGAASTSATGIGAAGIGGGMVPPAGALAFAILRNGSRIGTQRMEFAQAGDTLTIRSQAKLRVLILSIPVFHYAIEVVEHWSSAGFVAAASQVDDDGTRRVVTARRQAGFVAIGRSEGSAYRAPADALPFTHWNQAALRGPLIDMATGEVHRPRLTRLGWYRLPTLPDGDVLAQRYQLDGALSLADFYDRRRIWAGQEYRHRGHIIYERIKA